jgi:Zn-dependent protease
MDFFNTGIPVGRWFGINVRLHFTFLIYAYWQATKSGDLIFGLAFVAALYFCILLHEFGHALAARWCDGEANDILLWPLGGLAFVRPAWSPTAHLITTVAGPFVTLVLWMFFGGVAILMHMAVVSWGIPWSHPFAIVYAFVVNLKMLNRWLLLFNLIPAFPMDGGRMLRDTLWHWMSAETATRIAVRVSWVIAAAGAVFAVYIQDFWLLVFPLFIFWQSASEQQMLAYEAGGAYQFSLRERLRRGGRQRAFRGGVREFQRDQAAKPFHQCATCGATERDMPRREFRVCTDCSDGREYCDQHLESHVHG